MNLYGLRQLASKFIVIHYVIMQQSTFVMLNGLGNIVVHNSIYSQWKTYPLFVITI